MGEAHNGNGYWFPRAYDFLVCFLPYYCLRFRVQMRAIGEMLSDPFCITTVQFIITQPKPLIIIFPLRASFLLLNDLHSIPTTHFSTPRPSFSSLTRFPHPLSFFLPFFPYLPHSFPQTPLTHPYPSFKLSLPSPFLPSILPLPSSYMHPIRLSVRQTVICIIPTHYPSLA